MPEVLAEIAFIKRIRRNKRLYIEISSSRWIGAQGVQI